jgi:hypothetical protein
MPKYKLIGKKEAKFFTFIEAENETCAIMKLDSIKEHINWLPYDGNVLTNGKELMIGQAEEVE